MTGTTQSTPRIVFVFSGKVRLLSAYTSQAKVKSQLDAAIESLRAHQAHQEKQSE